MRDKPKGLCLLKTVWLHANGSLSAKLANKRPRIYNCSFLFPLGFVSVLGVAFGSTAFDAELSADLDSEELLSDLLSDLVSDLESDLESELVSDDFESDLLSEEFFESEAADFLYESLR